MHTAHHSMFSTKPEEGVDSKIRHLSSPPATISKNLWRDSAASQFEELVFVARAKTTAVYIPRVEMECLE